jgi:hypothetical protein
METQLDLVRADLEKGTIFSSNGWVNLPEKLANQHPLYGNGGWSALLLFGVLIYGPLRILTSLIIQSSQPAISMGILLSIATLIPLIISGLLLVTHHKDTQKYFYAAFGLHLISVLIRLAFDESPMAGPAAAITVPTAIWASYIWLSKRINVTTQNRVRPNDPFLQSVGIGKDIFGDSHSSGQGSLINRFGSLINELVSRATNEAAGAKKATSRKSALTRLVGDIGSSFDNGMRKYLSRLQNSGEITPSDLPIDTIGRLLPGGVASDKPDLIKWKECPKCAEVIKRRARHCRHCSHTYLDADYLQEQNAFAALEDDQPHDQNQEQEKAVNEVGG